ncbi:hypothetical protein C9374_007656 [Naegleria lovaniensis]|uniref:Uncharacterized protein n=1 Tax=Naegleria lovaniensis TaxID=51637 RepID=A0AA88KIL4_NAELO|nr:uncharacterized protein C9374_007656 [Naegleria lovaniensis]KAG2379018.1 hypothetical protein C9374_007656 [Naegleria lovaniensis]
MASSLSSSSSLNGTNSRNKSSFIIGTSMLMLIVVLIIVSLLSLRTEAASSPPAYKQQNLEMEYNVKSKVNPNNAQYAYATLVSSVSYLMGALAMYKSILDLGGQYDLVLIVTGKRMNDIVKNIEAYRKDPLLSRVHIFIASYIDNPNMKIPEPRFIDTYNKLHLWKLDQYGYKRIVFIDADCIVFKNVDILFNCVGPVCSGSDMGNPEFFNGGMIVTEPSTKVYEDMISKMGSPAYKSYDGGEQGFLNLYFDFPYKAKGWELEKELDEAKTEEEKKAIMTKYTSDDAKGVWRIPYTWNTEVPIYYFFKYAWLVRLKRKIRVIHFNLPIKPWVFLSFPVLDGSYFWYKYVVQIPQFSIVPLPLVGLLLAEVFFLIFSLTLSKSVFPLLLSAVLPENSGLIATIHFKLVRIWSNLKNKKGAKRPISFYERAKKHVLLTIWPIATVAVTALFSFLIYFNLVADASYDPHAQWFCLFTTITIFSVIFLSFYQQFVREQTKQCIQTNFEQSQLLSVSDVATLNKKIIPFFFAYKLAVIILPTIDFLAVCAIIYLTRGLFLLNVVFMVTFAFSHLALVWFVLKNFGKQTIYSTFREMVKVQ